METSNKPRSELSQQQLQDQEDYEFTNGPLRILSQAVQNNSTVVISLRNNHKLIATVKAFDRHCNMILVDVKEFWYESNPSSANNDKSKSNSKLLRERFVSKMFLRGDSVVVVLKYQAEKDV